MQFMHLKVMVVFAVRRRILHHSAFEPLRNTCCFPSLCGWQCEIREHHCSRPCHHGTPKHTQGLLYPWHHNHKYSSPAGAWHVRGKQRRIPTFSEKADPHYCLKIITDFTFYFLFLVLNDFYFFHHSCFIVFCPFSPLQQGDQSPIHIHIHPSPSLNNPLYILKALFFNQWTFASPIWFIEMSDMWYKAANNP